MMLITSIGTKYSPSKDAPENIHAISAMIVIDLINVSCILLLFMALNPRATCLSVFLKFLCVEQYRTVPLMFAAHLPSDILMAASVDTQKPLFWITQFDQLL